MSTIGEWLERDESESSKLAMAVSLATTVEPEFLRAARLKLCPEIGAEAEALVWFSPLVATRSPSGITFLAGALHAIWDRLRNDQPLLERIHELTAAFHANISPSLRWEEEIVYWALRDNQEATAKITDLLQTLVKTMMVQQHSRLATWAERALPRFPDPVRNDPAFLMLAQAAFERGGRTGTIAGAATGPVWLKPSSAAMMIGVRLFGRAIEFSHPPSSEAQPVFVPSSRLVKILVSKTRDFAPSPGWPRQISLAANTTVTENVDLESELFVRPAGGQTFAIAPTRMEGRRLNVCLLALSSADENLATFLQSELATDFDLVRPNATAAPIQIAGCDVFLCIAAQNPAANSPDSRELLAAQECRRIIYIAPPREVAYDIRSAYMIVDFRQPGEWSTALFELKALLHQPYSEAGSLFGVPQLPAGYVDRPQVFAALQSALLQVSLPQIVLEGDSGSGRSTLAAALARDCSVRRRFPNGVFWIYSNTPTELRGDGRLFIFDYKAPASSFIQPEVNSGALYTKTPSFSSAMQDSIFTIPPWSNEELERLTNIGVPLSIVAESQGNPATFKLLATSLSRPGSKFTGIDSVVAQFFAEPGVADCIRRLGILVPDADLSPAVYRRAFSAQPSVEALNLLHEAGLITLSSESHMVIREALRADFRAGLGVPPPPVPRSV